MGVIQSKLRGKEGIRRSKMKTFFLLILILAIIATVVGTTGEGCGKDERGSPRQPGDTWKKECNRCRCLVTRVPACTRRLCQDFGKNLEPDLEVDVGGDDEKDVNRLLLVQYRFENN